MRLAQFLSSTVIAASLVLTPAPTKAENDFQVRTQRAWDNYAIPNGLWLSGDYTGDGRDDLLHVVNGKDYVHPWVATGGGAFNVRTFRPWRGYGMPNGVWLNADFTGDGRMDVVHVVNNSDYVHPWISNGNGTFNVRTFRPWRGYAMPNGRWLVADINGDGRDDLVHVVRNTDYIHTWISNGNGTFRVGTFRPWSGYAMPNGVWRTADLNGDGRDDLVHAVRGTDYVHTWMSNGNGTFRVGTFRPWRGYAIPNGQWHVGDFNGDARDDILHVVNNSNYVHTWLSRGNGTFRVGTFRPWSGYAVPNGIWRVADLDRDGKDDVFHAVNRTNYAHIWRSTTDHRFEVGTFSPWRGYAIPNGRWLTGDYDGDNKQDIMHVVNRTNYVHPWLSRLPAPNQMALEGLEITQTVQDMAHSVPLLEGKPTVARAYPKINASSSRTVRGRLYVYNAANRQSQTVTSLNSVTVDPSNNNDIRGKREDTNLGLNFRIPSNLLRRGQLYARVTGLTDASTGGAVSCSNCTNSGRWVTLEDAPTMRLRVFGMRYTQDGTNYAPGAIDYNLIRSWIRRVYPTDSLVMSQLTVNASATPPFTCGNINAQLAAIRAIEVGNNSVDARTHYYGLVDDGGFFMRGCSGVPSTPRPQTTSSGPTGSGTWGWDTDGSYGDWYTGHELGHSYGRNHIGSGCGDSDSDSSYPYPSGQLSGSDGRFVGFDVGDTARGIPMQALPGTTWTDNMSYCRNQWMSDYTYKGILARLRAENALAGGPTPGLVSAGAGAEAIKPAAAGPATIEEGSKADLPLDSHGSVGSYVAPAGTPPSEIVTEVQSPPNLDLLSPAYQSAPEIVFGSEVDGGAEVPEAATLDGPLPEELRDFATTADLFDAQTPPVSDTIEPMPMLTGNFVSVVATIDLTEKSGEIAFVNPVPQAFVSPAGAGEKATLVQVDADGVEISRHETEVILDSELHLGDHVTGIIDAVLDIESNVAAITLVVDGTEVDRFVIPSQNAEFTDGAEAVIEADFDASENSLAVTLTGVSDQSDGSTFTFEYSLDRGETWLVAAIGSPEPAARIDFSESETGDGIDLRVRLNRGITAEIIAQSYLELKR